MLNFCNSLLRIELRSSLAIKVSKSNNLQSDLQTTATDYHIHLRVCCCAIGGKIKELIKRSQIAREIMNFVVDCFRNFWLFQRATIVHKLPTVPTILRWFSVGICKYKPGYKSHDPQFMTWSVINWNSLNGGFFSLFSNIHCKICSPVWKL